MQIGQKDVSQRLRNIISLHRYHLCGITAFQSLCRQWFVGRDGQGRPAARPKCGMLASDMTMGPGPTAFGTSAVRAAAGAHYLSGCLSGSAAAAAPQVLEDELHLGIFLGHLDLLCTAMKHERRLMHAHGRGASRSEDHVDTLLQILNAESPTTPTAKPVPVFFLQYR